MTDPTDWLDDILAETAVQIPDDGFTDRVIAALPRPRPRRDVRAPVLFGATALGAAVAFLGAPGGSFIADALTAVAAYGLHPLHTSVPLAALAVLAATVGAAVNFVDEV
jgi:hypothetical protein